jgi:hypothetical protein
MKKTTKQTDRDWKDALSSIKSNIVKENETKKAHQREQENELRPYFKQAAYHLGISHQQLATEIKIFQPGLTDVLTDRRLTASTYAKLIKKHNPAYYQLFESKLKSAVKAERNYFQKKKESASRSVPAEIKETTFPVKGKRKLTKYEKRANKRMQQKKQIVKPVLPEASVRLVPLPISQWIAVKWQDVLFEDFLIKVKYGGNFSQGYPVSESRKSFRFLKNYIKSLRLPALSILLVGNEIRQIKNAESVREMATLLRIKEQLIEDFQKGKSTTAVAMMEKIKSVSKQLLTQIAIAGTGEVMCIEYLASQLAGGFKPIPAFEIIPSGNSLNTEDTFIFVLERKSKLFLVWESTVHGRATYVFKTNNDCYLDVVQAIYDYIGSPRKAKRMSLRKRDADTSNLGYDGYVTHSAFDHWQQKLEMSFSQHS